MQLGKTPTPPLPWPPAQSDVQAADEAKGDRGGSTLLGIALGWLRDDRDLRKKRELEAGGAKRGAKKDVSLPFSRLLALVMTKRTARSTDGVTSHLAADQGCQDVFRKVRLLWRTAYPLEVHLAL
jgi:hypothetical protein